MKERVTCLTFPFASAAYPHLLGHFQVTQVTQRQQAGLTAARTAPGAPSLTSLKVTQFPSRGEGTSHRTARLRFRYTRSLKGTAVVLAWRNVDGIQVARRAEASVPAALRPREFDVVSAAHPP